jgi:transposase
LVHIATESGNLSDQSFTLSLASAARNALPKHNLALVMDSGMGGNPNLKAIDAIEPPVYRVSGVPLRNSQVAEEALLAKPGRWKRHPYREDFSYRAVKLDAESSPSGREEWWVATRNHREAAKQTRQIERKVAQAKEAIELVNLRGEAACEAACRLIQSSNIKRYCCKSEQTGQYILDADYIKLEMRRAGVKVTRSTMTHLDAEVTLRAYDAQYGIEDEMRSLKSPIKIRPMQHFASERIKAHIVICGLALMLMRELERRTGATFETVQKEFARAQVMRMQRGAVEYWQRSEWSETAISYLNKLGLTEGVTTWGLTPEG